MIFTDMIPTTSNMISTTSNMTPTTSNMIPTTNNMIPTTSNMVTPTLSTDIIISTTVSIMTAAPDSNHGGMIKAVVKKVAESGGAN